MPSMGPCGECNSLRRLKVLEAHLRPSQPAVRGCSSIPTRVGKATGCGGVRIAYCVYGRQASPDRLPVLLLRGMGMTKEDSAGLAATMCRLGRVLVAVDNRGSGDSDFPETDFAMDHMALDAAAVMKDIGADKYHVLGFSMGGTVAQLLALTEPSAVVSLVVACSHFGGPGMAAVSNRYRALASQVGPSDEREFTEWVRTLFEYNFPEDWRNGAGRKRYAELLADFEEAERKRRDKPPRSATGQTRAVLEFLRVGIESRLKAVQCPTFVVTGDRDAVMPPRNSELLVERIPQAELCKLRGLGHMFWEQEPDKSAEVIANFWLRVEAK
eukprot:Hpha_TRINITY_DN15581_c0_g1::TRINITY_DN15581_c0_g1_i1::g.104204::m.104204